MAREAGWGGSVAGSVAAAGSSGLALREEGR